MIIRYRKPLCLFTVLFLLYFVQLSLANSLDGKMPITRTDTLADPLFGIEYHPSETHFEIAPNEIYKCGDIKAPKGNLFLFGQATNGKTHFYYVYGWEEVESKDGVRHFEAESDSGIICKS